MKQHRLLTIIKQPNGQLASSTGNITGVYDLSGGAWEMTAGYITNGNLSYGATASGIPPLVARTTSDATAYLALSSKYATIYPYSAYNDTRTDNYTAYKKANYGYGDAILETSSTGDNHTSWFADCSFFAEMTSPFFIYGASYGSKVSGGVFSFCFYHGNTYITNSFRAVLVA